MEIFAIGLPLPKPKVVVRIFVALVTTVAGLGVISILYTTVVSSLNDESPFDSPWSARNRKLRLFVWIRRWREKRPKQNNGEAEGLIS